MYVVRILDSVSVLTECLGFHTCVNIPFHPFVYIHQPLFTSLLSSLFIIPIFYPFFSCFQWHFSIFMYRYIFQFWVIIYLNVWNYALCVCLVLWVVFVVWFMCCFHSTVSDVQLKLLTVEYFAYSWNLYADFIWFVSLNFVYT